MTQKQKVAGYAVFFESIPKCDTDNDSPLDGKTAERRTIRRLNSNWFEPKNHDLQKVSTDVLLGTSNEELATLNEELSTLNEELQTANEELKDSNSKLQLAYNRVNRLNKERKTNEEKRLVLMRRLTNIEDEQRERIAREIHDDLGQELAGLMLGLHYLRSLLNPEKIAISERLDRLENMVNSMGQSIRRVSWELRPGMLDELGLAAVLEQYLLEWSQRTKLVLISRIDGFVNQPRLPKSTEAAVYRFVQEALTNVIKHARANNVTVIVERQENCVQAIVQDDGQGFLPDQIDLSPYSQGLGLLGIRERMELAGGDLEIQSEVGAGTALTIRVPAFGESPNE